ncbi:hypothetical protein BLA23254_03312 [Burkholderia lata]|uniref:Uncharacterized protein n=1 Tax=Burkholderia lata (strain ATCC 17760 / DSM 23089 / LMG 22485 / NCIMB 9086 / R18194 / 383) TaxID=482957 RepID=A0A6P2LNG8_BURL3|nr:hypothetical protein [Burkholderia lata]VWB70926.1 hypothetical protein BLA23254_03312 [Burkholderia lata]
MSLTDLIPGIAQAKLVGLGLVAALWIGSVAYPYYEWKHTVSVDAAQHAKDAAALDAAQQQIASDKAAFTQAEALGAAQAASIQAGVAQAQTIRVVTTQKAAAVMAASTPDVETARQLAVSTAQQFSGWDKQ